MITTIVKRREIRLNLMYPGSFMPETESFVVKSMKEGIEKAKTMFKKRRFYGFYFTSENYIVYNNKRYWQEDDDTQKNKRNPKVYLVAKKVLNYEEVAKLGENVLLSNMQLNGWKYVVKTVLGNYQPYDKRTIILDENFNLMQLPE